MISEMMLGMISDGKITMNIDGKPVMSLDRNSKSLEIELSGFEKTNLKLSNLTCLT
jgi:hypothetical protein